MRIVFLLIFQLFLTTTYAQNLYRATVINPDQDPIPYATVNVLGSQDYTVTDENGYFELTLNTEHFTLHISSIGYQSREVVVTNGELPSVIILEFSAQTLEQIVVTALGIEKEKQSLVSAVSVLQSEELTTVPASNLVNHLAGKVAGVQVTNGSSGVGSSSRILIRGQNSLSGGNQPLFVVDGMPISNELFASQLVNDGALQEVDYGNGAGEISPDDIESITILKGPGSAALYGARAANGVVLVSTKKGRGSRGLGITTNSMVTFETPLTLPDYQNEYGGGFNGEYAFHDGQGGGINDGGISSFGPRLDQGQLIPQFDSPSVDADGNPVRAGDVIARTLPDGTYTPITPTPWVSRPNNVRNFLETGMTFHNNIAFNLSGEKGSTRISYTNLRNSGIMPNTNLKRDGLAISLDQDVDDRLNISAFLNYVNSRSDNRPNLGYGYENPMYGFIWTGRQTNIQSLRDYWQAGQEGLERFDFNYLWVNNPYLTLYENTNGFNKNRVLGNVAADYQFSGKWMLTVRTGLDAYHDLRTFRRAVSTNANPFGSYREDQVKFHELNLNARISYQSDLGETWRYTLVGGMNRFDQRTRCQYSQASQLAIPGIYTLANSRTPLVGNSEIYQRRINSVFASGNLAMHNTLYLDMTFRNDWSSTLPADQNSFGYYSAGMSYILSNQWELPSWLTYLKLRMSAASVGNDTDPYQTVQNFLFNQNYDNDFKVTNETVLKNSNLKPERLNALEAGWEVWLWEDRLQADLAVYQNVSIDQIISRPISAAGGFQNYIVNGGEVRTRGMELLLGGLAVRNDRFSWNTTATFTTSTSVVTRLPGGVDQFVTATSKIFDGGGGSNTVFFIARENGRVGDMYGTGFMEVDGQVVYGSNGLPIQDGRLRLLGNYNPDFMLGWQNEFTCRNLSFRMLMDWRQGGTIVSRTRAIASTSGVLKETLVGRENGIVGEGIVNVGTTENPEYVPNTTVVSAGEFYNNFYDRGNEASALYDATYVKLREMSVYYHFPARIVQRWGMEGLSLGLVGRNLLLWTENPHFDPELNAFEVRDIVYGVEDISYPSSRSFGISLKTQF